MVWDAGSPEKYWIVDYVRRWLTVKCWIDDGVRRWLTVKCWIEELCETLAHCKMLDVYVETLAHV